MSAREKDWATQVVPLRPGASPPESDPSRLIGAEVAGRYRVERLLAGGSMGHVYEAVQRPFGRSVALKILSVDRQRIDPRFHKRFRREASVASQLSHPNIVTIYDFGTTEGGDVYMAMEFLPGRPLSRVLQEAGTLPARRALNVAIQVGRALRRAHRVGVVHRDLKPANIIVMPDEDDLDFVKVLDFGLVKMFSDTEGVWGDTFSEEQLTTAGAMLGTPGYMAPEQAIGETVDTRADTYALGVVLFHMLTGRLPFRAKTVREIVSQQVTQSTPQITQVAPDLAVGPSVEPILNRCLARSPHDRYDRIEDLLAALKGVWRLENDDTFGTETGLVSVDLEGLPPLQDPPGGIDSDDLASPATDRSRRRAAGRWVAAGLVAAAVAVAAAVLGGLGLERPTRVDAPADRPAPASGDLELQPLAPAAGESEDRAEESGSGGAASTSPEAPPGPQPGAAEEPRLRALEPYKGNPY